MTWIIYDEYSSADWARWTEVGQDAHYKLLGTNVETHTPGKSVHCPICNPFRAVESTDPKPE